MLSSSLCVGMLAKVPRLLEHATPLANPRTRGHTVHTLRGGHTDARGDGLALANARHLLTRPASAEAIAPPKPKQRGRCVHTRTRSRLSLLWVLAYSCVPLHATSCRFLYVLVLVLTTHPFLDACNCHADPRWARNCRRTEKQELNEQQKSLELDVEIR